MSKPHAPQPCAGLPPAAGIANCAGAMSIGFSVEACVARLKRHRRAFRRLHEAFIKRLTAGPVHVLKTAFSPPTPATARSMPPRDANHGGRRSRRPANFILPSTKPANPVDP